MANEDHPFLRYLGLSLLYPNPIVDPTIKRKSAERILLSTLNFVKEKEKEAFLSEFNRFIGKDAIPSLSSDFFKNWIYTLFAYGRESEEVAIKVLKEHPPQAFSFQLIPELATRRPGYALQLFMTMNLRDFPNEAFSSILACGRIVHELRTKTLEHDSLIKFMSAKIPELLDHKEHKKPKNAKKLSSNLYLFVEYDPSTEIARKGLELGYFNDKEKEACNRLLCLPGLESAFKSPSCSLFKERLKEALIKNLLSEADQLHYLLKFYNDRPDDNDPLLFSNFIKLDCASIRNDEQKIEFLEALSTLLKVRSFKKKQSEKKQIELILERLKDYIPLLSSCRDLFIRCYTLNIKLPRSLQEIWYKTLLLWIKDENPDYLKIYDLLIEGEKRNFALDRFSAEVMLILSEKWKNKAAHSNRLFLLLQKIALLSPMIENKGRLYDLFIDLLKTKERYLPLINTFAEEEPLPPYKQIIESVLILLHTSQNDNAKFKFVVNWFITTPFFQPIKGDNQLNKLIQEIIQLILKRGYSNKDDWNTTLYELVAAYVEEMRSMEDKVWEPLINYFQKTKNIKTIDLYYLVDKEGLLAEDRFPFFLLCACAICLMKDNKDPRFLEIMQNPNKYIEICMKSNQPILFLISNIAFIESATTFHYFFKENPRIKDHIIEIYTLSRKMYSEVQPQVELLKDPDKEKQSEILNYIDPGLDLAFLEFFYKIELFSEASNHLDTILSSPHTDNYWKSFGNFINILLSTTNPELIVDDIDKILDTTKILYADNIDLKSLINLLMKFSISDSTDFEKKIKRYKTAAFFLESALRYKSLPPNHAIWGHYFSLIDFFNEANEHERAEILIKSLELNLSSVGEDFLSQAYESSLHQWEENSEPNNLSELISQNLDLISKYTYGEEDFIKLFTYFKVLDKFSRLSKSNFLYILDLFKKTFEIGSKTKKTSSRKVSLPKEGYFQLISLLIEILSLEIKDRSHPFPELIEQQIQEYLDVLINRFPEYPYIDRLNHLFFHSFESILYRWSLNVNDRDKDRLLWYLYDWIRNLPGMNAEGNEKFSIFISLFFFGLERVSLIDEEEFSKVLNAFVSILEVRSKQEEKSEYKLYLKENEYFNIKILLIRNLLNVAGKDQPEHPFLKTVELEIKKHLGILMKEFRKVDYSRLLQEFKLIQQRRSTDQE
ncbi:MAG: hypothetical protein JJU12_05410 [Chlamydiales bacterium]|nr:hypothetical protein [Chlamydiales bacterium]